MAHVARERSPVGDYSSGSEMYDLIRELYPIARSLTGEGVRETLRRLHRYVPFQLIEVPSGTRVYDWVVPDEWNIREAWIADPSGNRVIDLIDSPLHVLGYSIPIRTRIPFEELRRHVFTLPEHPNWIPFRTSYYGKTWGFCLTQKQFDGLTASEYEICIDASLEPGHLTYGEFFIQGEREDEVIVSANVCHPAQCNDGLSGLALITMLARYLLGRELRYSYRFLLSPGTLGPLSWLSANEEKVSKIRHGLVATCVGDSGRLTYKRTRRGDAEIDRAVTNVLKHYADDYEIQPFVPWGGDERQFCSPGFDLPVGVLMRTPPGAFPEYHSSADDLTFVRPDMLDDSFAKYLTVIDVLERNATYVNRNPKGEPQLGARGLYRTISGGASATSEANERTLLWVLNLSDGRHDLLEISDRSGSTFSEVRAAAEVLERHDLLEEENNDG
jgi:aminopeptidase-like protein